MIIGQGIAGSMIAFELYKRAVSFDIINKTDYNSSSHVAAGLYNPITGRKMVKTWNADKVFSGLEHYYEELERFLRIKFLNSSGIYRPFFSLEEQNDWQGRLGDGGFEAFVEEVKSGKSSNEQIKDRFGGLYLKNAGYVNTTKMLEAFKKFYIRLGAYQELDFDFGELLEKEDSFGYGGSSYKKVIFCEGNNVRNNPYFKWLPLRPVKGEILDVNIDYKESFILNRGVFMLPETTEGYSRVGSTYDNHRLDHEPTMEGLQYLTDKLGAIYTRRFDLVKHRAGIRPATLDRKPFMGRHPVKKELTIFNGLGTKGVSLAVYYAKQFAEYLMNEKPIDDEVNIERFLSFYSN